MGVSKHQSIRAVNSTFEGGDTFDLWAPIRLQRVTGVGPEEGGSGQSSAATFERNMLI
jgi:hypothetical protein